MTQRQDPRTGGRAAPAQLALLARAGEVLSGTFELEPALERVALVVCPAFADACAVDLREPDGSLRRVVAQPAAAGVLPQDVAHGARVVARTGEPELVTGVRDPALRARGIVTFLCVPLVTPAGLVGVLSLTGTEAREPYEAADLRFVEELARRIALAVERMRLHGSLRRSEERYRLLFEQSPLPMWVYDARTLAFLAVNDAAVRHYGFSREEFLAMTIRDIRPSDDVRRLVSGVDRGNIGSPIPETWRHRRKDGSLIDVEITAGRVVFEGRDAALVLANDVSERKLLEARLAEAEKMEAIGRLAGGVAHDFNNLLTVISGYTSLLRARGAAGGDELAEIAHAAEQAAALTRELLAFSSRQVLHPHVLDLNGVIAGMRGMLGRIIGDDVEVRTALGPGLPPIAADRAQLERVVLNLAANARDAMPGGGRLTIETSALTLDADEVQRAGEGTAGANVLLRVSDTGVGMDDEVQRRLFEPFFTTKAPGAGTGLGLATVFGVVKQSGGSIRVSSETGRGTIFEIAFPAAEGESAEAPAADLPPAATSGRETVLLVEDDAGVRELARLLLERNGYHVLECEDGEAALRLVAERTAPIDLLLSDVVMPGLGGPELAEELAAALPGLRVLFMSGYAGDAAARGGMGRGDAPMLEKPFTEHELTRRVREVLDRTAAR